jgi:iron complex transport system substrate-binding protein
LRIASLLPAATEWVYAFGAGGDLVARSHLCDYPPGSLNVPAVTRPLIVFTSERDSAAIDREVRAFISQGLSPNEIDIQQLGLLEPDVILAQDDCRACAPFGPDLQQRIGDGIVQVETYAPMTLKQAMDGALRIARVIGRMREGIAWLAAAEKRLALLRERLGLERRMDEQHLPAVLCIEWLDPFMAAAHWTPDLIRMAGGQSVLGQAGFHAEVTGWEEIINSDPDVIVLAPCGYPIDRTQRELASFTSQREWAGLRAVRQKKAWILDGASYVNRPGPRLYRSIEMLAAAIHPQHNLTSALDIKPWELRQIC